MAKPEVEMPNKSLYLSKTVIEVKSFYNKHFPTDRKTYNLRVPFVGLILSICTVYLLPLYVFKHEEIILPQCLLIFIAIGVGYELYYGLKIGDRKQFTPWIILKVIELLFTLVINIWLMMDLWFFLPIVVYAWILFVLNGLVTYTVINKSFKMFRGSGNKSNIPDEDNFDDGDVCEDV
ncbi:hypothetical protein Zmor_000914 [Zophobas morio]|uniref:Uncharacterized protein n=1 Tax=Zophobas morio TaxID=2755281 RepID=A0AA38J0Z1_9CUCU|nr:hypothetical protein Zmor_000914 [Zophobas morio]